MNAYVLNVPGKNLYLAFGNDCMEAGQSLANKLGVDVEAISVGGSWKNIAPGDLINLSGLWSYFTATPSARHLEDGR